MATVFGATRFASKRPIVAFIEIPKAHHGQLLEGEVVMVAALTWLETNAKGR